MENIVEMHNVYIDYPLKKYTLHAVSDVSMVIKRGKITALVGESGSGKTTLSSALIRCISEPGKVASGVLNLTYLINEDLSLPAVSLVTDPDNLWSSTSGIYVAGGELAFHYRINIRSFRQQMLY